MLSPLSTTKWPETTLSLREHVAPSTWYRIAQALHDGKNVIECAGEFERSSIISWANDILDADIVDYRGQSSDKQWYACSFLNKLAKTVCSVDSEFDREIFEEGEKEYVLQRENGKVFFNEITTKKPFFVFGKEQPEVSVKTLYEVDISKLMEAANVLFTGEIVAETNHPILSLLINNPIFLGFLAEQVIHASRLQQGQVDPALAKHALRYDWEQKHVVAVSNPPTFPQAICGTNFSPSLRAFLHNGQLPPSELERNHLLGEAIHELMMDTPRCDTSWYKDNFEDTECDLYHAIIKDTTHLNFELIDSKSVNKFFYKLCWFLANHYEGNSIIFRRLPPKPGYYYRLDCWVQPLCYLLQRNPNLTSIGLQDFSISPEIIQQLLALVNKCGAISDLTLNNGDLNDKHAEYVARNLAPHVVNLSLKDNQFTLPGILALLKSKTLTSLDLGVCSFTTQEQEQIIQALQKNRTLTMFEIGAWNTAALHSQCEIQLRYNKSQFYKVQMLSQAPVAPDMPRELFYQIAEKLNFMSR